MAEHWHTALVFLETHLDQRTYFGGECLNLVDIVVSATIPLFQRLGFSLAPYPQLSHWCQAVMVRPAWQASRPSDAKLDAWQQVMRRWIRVSQKRRG